MTVTVFCPINGAARCWAVDIEELLTDTPLEWVTACVTRVACYRYA